MPILTYLAVFTTFRSIVSYFTIKGPWNLACNKPLPLPSYSFIIRTT